MNNISIVSYVKSHPSIANLLWKIIRFFMKFFQIFFSVDKKSIIFSSFGGRNFNDSPKALYDAMCVDKNFNDWRLIWAFVEPDRYDIPRGEKIDINSFVFFKTLLTTHVWIGNSEIDRGVRFVSTKHVRIETWHGTPLKKICGEENQTSVEKVPTGGKIDMTTIRCAQSPYDREIYARIFNASIDAILLSDLPRNDELLKYSKERIASIKKKIGILEGKKVLLYTPTYREFISIGDNKIVPPIDFKKWEEQIGDSYVLLIRAHYVVAEAMKICESAFVKNVSGYSNLNDLFAISDMMISDYSSTFFDYAILDRPMFCFAYDLDEYKDKRGLYLNLEKELPCPIDKDEDSLLSHIKNVDIDKASKATKDFHEKYAPYAGHSCEIVIDTLKKRLKSD